MKKLFWMPLAVLAVFALAFAGCGGGGGGDPDPDPDPDPDYVPVAGEITPPSKTGFTPVVLVGLEVDGDEETGDTTVYPVTTNGLKIKLTEAEIVMINEAPEGSFIRVYFGGGGNWYGGEWYCGAEGQYDDYPKFGIQNNTTSSGGYTYFDVDVSDFIDAYGEDGAIPEGMEITLQRWNDSAGFAGVFLYKATGDYVPPPEPVVIYTAADGWSDGVTATGGAHTANTGYVVQIDDSGTKPNFSFKITFAPPFDISEVGGFAVDWDGVHPSIKQIGFNLDIDTSDGKKTQAQPNPSFQKKVGDEYTFGTGIQSWGNNTEWPTNGLLSSLTFFCDFMQGGDSWDDIAKGDTDIEDFVLKSFKFVYPD